MAEVSTLRGAATGPARPAQQRRSDVVALLERERHAWIATAGPGGAHLVPLGCAWDGGRLVMATHASHRTVSNLRHQSRARIALGTATDVVLIDGEVEIVGTEALPPTDSAVLARLPMDPRQGDDRVYLFFTPRRIMTWRNRGELAERTIMSAGRWLA
jgi:hypothetical protein